MDLSVIIVNYNVRYYLEQCLLSLEKAAAGINCEIIVVDNNSADGSCDMVSRKFPNVILHRNSSNLGFSAACNQAINISAGRYILLLNPDTLVEEDAFKKCSEFMVSHPGAGALGVKMLNGSGRFLPESKRAFPAPAAAFFKMTGLSWLFPKSKFFNRYYLGHLDESLTSEADIISGAFMFIAREALEKVGPLDEKFFMYGEDIDLSYRILKAGYKNYYYPHVRIIHYKGESTREGDINNTIYFYQAMLVFADKHFGNQGFGLLKLLLRLAIFTSGFVSLLKKTARSLIIPAEKMLSGKKRIAVVCNSEVYQGILQLAELSYSTYEMTGRISINPADRSSEVIGNIGNIREIIRSGRIREIIISTFGLNVSFIINTMQTISEKKVTIKIAPEGENLLIGSRSLSSSDDAREPGEVRNIES